MPVLDTATILITIGGLLLAGLALDLLGRRTRIPRVTLLVAFGFLAGPDALDLLPPRTDAWFSLLTTIALVMVGFLLGERFTPDRLRRHGREILVLSITVVLGSAAAVAIGSLLAGASLTLALMLAAAATATDPAATHDAVRETRSDGPLTDTILGVVAIDDAWGLLVFSIVLAVIAAMTAGDGSVAMALFHGVHEVGGALLLGALLGLPVARLSHRIEPGEPTLLEALGIVLLCGGLAVWLEVSYILAAMTLGAITANLGRHQNRPFHAIEGIERPFMILFFILAGASFRMDALLAVTSVALAYVVCRILGRVLGAWAGGRMAGVPAARHRWTGFALLPQAGVALGMALLAVERVPELASTLMPIVIGATVVFELLGPICTRMALSRAGEIDADQLRDRET